MEVLAVQTIFKTIISEGLKAIFNPLKEKLHKYYKIKTLTHSILKRIKIYIESEEYDFRGYLEIVINPDFLTNINDPDILETIENTLKKDFFNKLDGHNAINILKEKLKQDTYLSMEFLKEKLTLEFFFDLFGDPKLNEEGNEKKKKVIESIWRTFNVEALEVVKTKNIIIDMYIDLQGDLKEIKSYLRDLIVKLKVKDTKSEKRKIYDKLWNLLVDVQFAADELWKSATEDGIRDFSRIYREVLKEIRKNKYDLKSKHQVKLVELLHQFELYTDGKQLLVDTKKRKMEDYENRLDENEQPFGTIRVKEVLGLIIENNRKIRTKYLELLSEVSDHFDEILKKKE